MADKYFGGIKAGSTSVTFYVPLRNLTDNLGTTGKLAANLTLAYQRTNTATATQAASDLALITTAFAAGGVKEADATYFPGVYRIDFPDAAFAAGVDFVELGVLCAGTLNWVLMVPLSSDVVQSGDVLAAAGKNAIADALLVRHQQGGAAGGAGTKVSDALAGGLMSLSIAAGVLTVKNADGTTAYTRTLTRSALDAIVTAV